MIAHRNQDTETVIMASVGPRGAAVLARLGYVSESAIDQEKKRAERRERLDALKAQKERERAAALADLLA